ncbi:MAG: nitrate reductase [Candidatus Binatia bacterium]|nr:nitrate reductase [Candidatus Binatia bacterium]
MFLHTHDGPLTRDLLRSPGRYGLGQLPRRLTPDSTTRTVCGFCSTGCALTGHLRDGQAINLSPAPDYPVNLGMACPKGWEALAPLDDPGRATRAQVRNARGEWEPVGWDPALREMVLRFRAVAEEHGSEALAFLGTGQIPTEEMVFLGALAKFGMGMKHGDGNTRQCMATSVVAYKEAFGFDAPPYTYADFEESDVIVLAGSNLCVAHPILWERICRNRHAPEVVVIDPRRTETATAGTQHYPIRPKSDLAFYYAVASVLIDRGWIDQAYVDAHTEDFEAFASHVRPFTPDAVAASIGLPAESVLRLAETIHTGRRVSLWWTMGVNQSHEAVRTAQALINLALLTGNMGRPGTGANSITGQCNAMGSRLFSNTTSLFAGHEFTNPDHRSKIAGILGIDEKRIPRENGLPYDGILEEIRAGRIRALWIIATNPAHSWINQTEFRETLSKLDVLVVQDLYADTETAQQADILLPAAGWGEKDGTFINSERRIGLVKKMRQAPGEALADFHIFRLVAEYWGVGELFDAWQTPEDVFRSMQEMSAGRPCDITGIAGYDAIEEEAGIQWPHPTGAVEPERERRLFEDGRFFTTTGRARFCFDPPRPPEENVDAAYPFVLMTGRGSSSQWHTGTRTDRSPVLRKLHRPDLWIEIHPDDAAHLSISPEETVVVRSRRGSLRARAVVRDTVRPGHVFLPMHDPKTNHLTHPTFDPHSHQPSYKHCAVSLRRSGDVG